MQEQTWRDFDSDMPPLAEDLHRYLDENLERHIHTESIDGQTVRVSVDPGLVRSVRAMAEGEPMPLKLATEVGRVRHVVPNWEEHEVDDYAERGCHCGPSIEQVDREDGTLAGYLVIHRAVN